MKTEVTYRPTIEAIEKAALNLKEVALKTPLVKNDQYSQKYQSTILFKREDLQQVRSYKIRGAYNKISSLTEKQRAKGIICASAGNHAQGVALSCKLLKIYGVIYMPSPTPKQKINCTLFCVFPIFFYKHPNGMTISLKLKIFTI